MINQTAVSVGNKKAYLFCRNNTIFLSQEGGERGIQALQTEIENRFNISVLEEEIYVFCRKTNGKSIGFKLADKGILNVLADESILSVSTDDVFVYGKNISDIFYSKNNVVFSFKTKKVLFSYDKFLKTVFLCKMPLAVFEKNGSLMLYNFSTGEMYELYKNIVSVIDFSLCGLRENIYVSLLIKNGSYYEVIYKTIENSKISKGIDIIKTQKADNTFVFNEKNKINIVISRDDGKVYSRYADTEKMDFSPLQSNVLSSAAKICFYDLYGNISDALCLLDGTIIYPKITKEKITAKNNKEDNFYEKTISEKDRIINEMNMRLVQLQKNSAQTIQSLNQRLNEEKEKNAVLETKIESMEKMFGSFDDKTKNCTLMITSAKEI